MMRAQPPPVGCSLEHTLSPRFEADLFYLAGKTHAYVHAFHPIAFESKMGGYSLSPAGNGWFAVPHWALRREHVPPEEPGGPCLP